MQNPLAPSGHRPQVAGNQAAVQAQPAPRRHRAYANSRRRAIVIAATALVGLALMVHGGRLVFAHMSAAARPHSRVDRTQRITGSAADEWIRANVPAGTQLLTDGFDPPAGYQPVSLETAGSNWKSYHFLVTSKTSDPLADSVLAGVWKSSTPVAIFSKGEVRYVLARTSPDEIRRNREVDRVERLQAGAALQANPHLTSLPASKNILSSGQLDLRAAAVLTALVMQVPFVLDQIVGVAPEAAAGMPARLITVYSSDPGGFSRALGGVVPSMAPDEVTVGENGAIRLHWPLSVTPMPSVN